MAKCSISHVLPAVLEMTASKLTWHLWIIVHVFPHTGRNTSQFFLLSSWLCRKMFQQFEIALLQKGQFHNNSGQVYKTLTLEWWGSVFLDQIFRMICKLYCLLNLKDPVLITSLQINSLTDLQECVVNPNPQMSSQKLFLLKSSFLWVDSTCRS